MFMIGASAVNYLQNSGVVIPGTDYEQHSRVEAKSFYYS